MVGAAISNAADCMINQSAGRISLTFVAIRKCPGNIRPMVRESTCVLDDLSELSQKHMGSLRHRDECVDSPVMAYSRRMFAKLPRPFRHLSPSIAPKRKFLAVDLGSGALAVEP